MLKSEANPADVATIDSIITAAYDGISGPAGTKRDWDRERSLYIPGARLIPMGVEAGREGVDLAPHILDIEGFIARVEPFFDESGFYEKEIARRSQPGRFPAKGFIRNFDAVTTGASPQMRPSRVKGKQRDCES